MRKKVEAVSPSKPQNQPSRYSNRRAEPAPQASFLDLGGSNGNKASTLDLGGGGAASSLNLGGNDEKPKAGGAGSSLDLGGGGAAAPARNNTRRSARNRTPSDEGMAVDEEE